MEHNHGVVYKYTRKSKEKNVKVYVDHQRRDKISHINDIGCLRIVFAFDFNASGFNTDFDLVMCMSKERPNDPAMYVKMVLLLSLFFFVSALRFRLRDRTSSDTSASVTFIQHSSSFSTCSNIVAPASHGVQQISRARYSSVESIDDFTHQCFNLVFPTKSCFGQIDRSTLLSASF